MTSVVVGEQLKSLVLLNASDILQLSSPKYSNERSSEFCPAFPMSRKTLV